jgi:prepilin-type N-terminal cleavage/methylation domain-containing protein
MNDFVSSSVPSCHQQRGFTLIELLVVIAVISLLSSVVLSSLNLARAKARDALRIESLRQAERALELYYHDHGEYPSTGGQYWSGKPGCGTPPSVYSGKGYVGPNAYVPGLAPEYIPELPRDPGTRCYFYVSSAPDDYMFAAWGSIETIETTGHPLRRRVFDDPDTGENTEQTLQVSSPEGSDH